MKKIDIACIIDDDPIYVFGTKKLMENIGFSDNYLVFKNGQEAIERLKEISTLKERMPELILLDLNMPIMDGWEFLDEFTKINTDQKVHVYILTSSIDPADIERAHKYRYVSNYLIKPISKDNLEQILVEYM